MITVFPNTRGLYITIADTAAPNYRDGPAPGDPVPMYTLDPGRAVELVQGVPEITGDAELLKRAGALIDSTKLGYPALPGVGHLVFIEREGGGYRLVSDDDTADLPVSALELAAIFRAMATKYQWTGW